MIRKILGTMAVLSALAGVLTLSVLALFTDTASVGSNTFTTGTVDISTSPASAVVTFSAMAPVTR